MKQLNKIKTISTDILFYLAILFFIIGFNFSDNMAGGWYQQFMPDIGNRQVTDITFLDSLTGYAVASPGNDSTYVLKTTNSGDNWQIIYRNYVLMSKLQFLNLNTGYACGGYLYKTINGGLNWTQINNSGIPPDDMYILNEDTIWITDGNGSTSLGLYRTTNGGASWQPQLNQGASNPDRIYMFNARIGFANRYGGSFMYNTTNSGLNWTQVAGTDGFSDIYFADSLTGWKALGNMKKTTDGGYNWVIQTLPHGGNIITSGITRFSNVNKDTIWGVGGWVFYPGNGNRGMIYRTTNGGENWLFQVPDTSIHLPQYAYVEFVNKLNGWAYGNNGVHTNTGGDTVWYMGIQQLSHEIPKDFILKQNYPNPFNPRTVIPYSIKSSAHVKLIAYNILGEEVQRLVDNYQQAGEYEVDFMGKFTASGVYFYRMTVDGKVIDTKKMLMIK